ncbi:MAG TPA: hypothetical protein VGA36_00655 [Nitriliruptorales bacterium]
MLAADAAFQWPSILERATFALTIVAAVALGIFLSVALYRILTSTPRHRPSRPARPADPADVRDDPELKLIIDLTEQHLAVMRERRDRARSDG